MEQNELNTLLRDADRIDRLPPIDTLVDEGIRRGRHRLRTRRLTAVGVLGTSLATLGAVVAFGLPAGGPGTTIAPAAVPTTKPSPSESSKPAPKDKGTFPTVAQLTKIMKANLPAGLAMRQVAPTDERNNHDIVFELVDEHGRGWAGGGVLRSSWDGWKLDDPCEAPGCTQTKIDEGTLRITRDQEKVGRGIWYWLYRPNGTVVWFGQANAFQGNGPVTRDRHALTDEQAIKLITAPAWDKLAQALPKQEPVDREQEQREKEKAKVPPPSEKAKR